MVEQLNSVRIIIKKKYAHSKYVLPRCENDMIEYGRLRHKTKIIRHSKKNLDIYIVNKTESNPEEFYSYVCNEKDIT